ncbi:arylamine N-acetyltransferase family protein [Streptomyces sp. NRRL S-1521]|uniref:arylamine N-acetyltransferase family protein n=1 Tax=Streptomyces sp. NRRL S-1521 TaxID=1609100 RepID=UPI00074AD5B8|nr:arylamine N-acetyltransferase [Streptomyces sp. NRRL S-1521]KUL54141.1 acetyltransferase [Streptomyces sp. NRRL S-1521]
MDIEQTEAYLRRIGAERPASPSARALRELHVAHLRSVPFENLSIHLGEEIELVDEALVAKVVEARRGGFCYELNGAFAALLASLGFDVTLLQGRVYGDGGRLGIPFDHLALRVRTQEGGDWLADVGFGAHSQLPLRFGERDCQADPAGTFRLVRTAAGDLDVLHDGTPQYLLEERPRELADFRAGAWYHRTSPESHFTRNLVCSILTEDGRITLSGRRLTTTVDGERHVSELASEAEVLAAYERHFGIVLKGEPVLGRVT